MLDIFKKKDALEMSYREFKLWCSERACDGCWSQLTATVCLSVINVVDHAPVWKRKKEWAYWHDFVVNEFVKPTNEMISAAEGGYYGMHAVCHVTEEVGV